MLQSLSRRKAEAAHRQGNNICGSGLVRLMKLAKTYFRPEQRRIDTHTHSVRINFPSVSTV
eukprot:1534192-Amphidinium_carterae.1